MTASEIRKEARESLKEKWGKGVLITIMYFLVTLGMEIVSRLIPGLGAIAVAVIGVPISYGLIVSFMKLKRGEEVSCVDFLVDGFQSFGRAWGVTGNIMLKLLVPIIVAIVLLVLAMVVGIPMIAVSATSYGSTTTALIGTIVMVVGMIGYFVAIIWAAIRGLYYSLAMFILKDHPELTGKEIVEKSKEYMTGNRWKYVCLSLSFIGWALLASLTLGIGMLWLIPYMQVALVVFYEDKAGVANTTQEETEVIEEK